MAEFEDEGVVEFVRHRNRVLRRANKVLRNTNFNLQKQADENFAAIVETKTESELAIEELWMRGELQCSPEDYYTIVELAVEALQQHRRRISAQSREGLENIEY
jgi:hypothetical protein